jgi:hypothetical protein
MESDFFSKVKHVIGYGFSGYRLGFSRKQWILVLDQELDLNWNGSLRIRSTYVLTTFFELWLFTPDIGLWAGYWILKPL